MQGLSNYSTVETVNGTLTVTLSSGPTVAPVIADFSVKQSVGGFSATVVTPTAISTSDLVVTLTVSPITATTVDQIVNFSVSYKDGVLKSVPAFTVDKRVDPQIAIITEATAALEAYEAAPLDNAEEITAAEALEATANTKVALITDANTNTNTKADLEARITTRKQAVELAKAPN